MTQTGHAGFHASTTAPTLRRTTVPAIVAPRAG